MSIFSGLDQIVKEDYSLAKQTWYGLGGKVKYFIQPTSLEQLQDVSRRCLENNLPVRVMGFGSNLLITDDNLPGAVIKLSGGQFEAEQFDGTRLTVWAGVDMGKLALNCVKKGLSGLEALTGIPGCLGGMIKMNAGGNFGDIGAVVEKVTLMDKEGNVFEKSKPELEFDYRSSNITAPFILNATLNLNEGDPDQILKVVKEIWVYKKNSQPLNTKNSGCVFKNPRGVSAGALIDRAGLKGLQIGGAVVSEKHANFIIAKDGCQSKDVMRLIETIKQKVKEEYDIELELEIEVWN